MSERRPQDDRQAPPFMFDVLGRLRAALTGVYVLDREIGRGGMAAVYLAHDVRHDRSVAVKVLHPHLTTEVGAERFLREIRIAARLRHANIVDVYDSGEADGVLYYVMPYVEGESLRGRLERETRLAIPDALRIAREVAEALDFAHERGVVHRDIKPENILLASGGPLAGAAHDRSGSHVAVADFGIARAMHPTDGETRLTVAGTAPGTPAYMSPEQASGERELDGRSDIYSLGCVLFEMLAGRPPFEGPTGPMIVAKHLTESPPPVRRFRPDTPAALEAVIARALEKGAADRYARAADFADAIIAAGGERRARWGVRRISSGTRRFLHRRWPWVAGVLATAGVAAAAVLLRPERPRAIDPELYVVLPSAPERIGAAGGAGAGAVPAGDDCAERLSEAFAGWRGMPLVGREGTRAATAGWPGGAPRLSDALRVARQLGAGRLVLCEGARSDAGGVRVLASLYDVSAPGAPLAQSRAVVAEGARGDDEYAVLAADVLLEGAPGKEMRAALRATQSYAAWRAYGRGRAALSRWGLDTAERELRSAVAADGDFPHAHLWLAELLAWTTDADSLPDAWAAGVGRAVARRSALAPYDAALAGALDALAKGRFDEACARYDSLEAQHALEFVVQFGRGECRARDDLVLRDPNLRSPSGWRFRSSYHTAVEAYRQAFGSNPAALRFASERLPSLLYAKANQLRPGVAIVDGERKPFAAYPSLGRGGNVDTLAFVPYPSGDFNALRAGTNPPSTSEAVDRSRRILRDIAVAWVASSPESPRAHEALAKALEALGEIEPTGAGDRSAAGEMAAAIARAGKTPPLRLFVARTRLLVKARSFDAARALADSLLAANPAPKPEEADSLAGLAALTGRAGRTAELLRIAAPRFAPTANGAPFTPPPARAVLEAGAALLGYAALGAPAESIRAYAGRVDSAVRSFEAPQRREQVRDALLARPATLGFPALAAGTPAWSGARGDFILEMQRFYSRGEPKKVRAVLDTLRRARAHKAPSDISIDAIYAEALLLHLMGETAAAIDWLDPSLNSLATLPDLSAVPQSATLVRAMALRADLAARAGDAAAARRWAGAVVSLWRNADDALRPTVERMRGLAAR